MDAPDTQTPPESKLHFLDYWRIVRIRKAIIISVFLITTIIATAVTFVMRPVYSSTAQIKIEPDYIADIQQMNGGMGPYAQYDPYFMETEQKVIQGEVVLSRVVVALNLTDEWGKKFGMTLKTRDCVEMLRREISLDADRNTKLIDVTVYSDDRDMAARIANAVVDAYYNYRLDQHAQLASGGIKSLDAYYQDEESQILMMQSNVDNLRDTLNIHDTDPNTLVPSTTLTTQELQHYNELRIELGVQYTKQNELLSQLESVQATNPAALRDILPTVNPDSELQDLLTRLHATQQKYVQQTNYEGVALPDREAALSLIDQLNQEIDTRVNGIMVGLESEANAQKKALDALNDQVEQAKGKDMAEAIHSQPYWEAKRKLQEKLDTHKLLGERIMMDKVDVKIPRTALVTVTDPATPGKAPVKPKKTLNIVLGAFFGLVVGLGLAFFIEYLDTSVKTIDEVERVFRSPVVGVIPQNVGNIVQDGADSPHGEAYRVLRTNILFSRKDENLNSIVIVSAGMGEGKSTTALNLAAICAQAGQRTLLVDSDLRRPTLHKFLHLGNNVGLTNYLLKQNTLEEVIQTSNVPMLDFMASGKLPGGFLNILGSAQMRNLVSELKQRYDFIVFDSPPIMGVSDASVLASEVDMAIQVIQYRRYPQLMNIRAKQMVEKAGGNLAGIVLNNISMARDESYYYYGGYYSRNEDSEQPRETVAAKNSSGDTDRINIRQKY